MTVRNTSNQPLYLNLPEGRAIKIRARDTADLSAEDLDSPALVYHISRGTLVVIQRSGG
jgi:hypothetical protein